MRPAEDLARKGSCAPNRITVNDYNRVTSKAQLALIGSGEIVDFAQAEARAAPASVERELAKADPLRCGRRHARSVIFG